MFAETRRNCLQRTRRLLVEWRRGDTGPRERERESECKYQSAGAARGEEGLEEVGSPSHGGGRERRNG